MNNGICSQYLRLCFCFSFAIDARDVRMHACLLLLIGSQWRIQPGVLGEAKRVLEGAKRQKDLFLSMHCHRRNFKNWFITTIIMKIMIIQNLTHICCNWRAVGDLSGCYFGTKQKSRATLLVGSLSGILSDSHVLNSEVETIIIFNRNRPIKENTAQKACLIFCNQMLPYPNKSGLDEEIHLIKSASRTKPLPWKWAFPWHF